MADAEHTLRHISYGYEILRWSVVLLVPLGVCVVEALCKSGCDTLVCSAKRLISGTCSGDTLGRI